MVADFVSLVIYRSVYRNTFTYSSIQVTRLQYLNALMASRIQNSPQSPDAIELKLVPSSQTKLLNDKNAAAGMHSCWCSFTP